MHVCLHVCLYAWMSLCVPVCTARMRGCGFACMFHMHATWAMTASCLEVNICHATCTLEDEGTSDCILCGREGVSPESEGVQGTQSPGKNTVFVLRTASKNKHSTPSSKNGGSPKCGNARIGLEDANRVPTPPQGSSKKMHEAPQKAARTTAEDAKNVTA